MKDSRMTLLEQECNICQDKSLIIYDAPMKDGRWAHMCVKCIETHGKGKDGPGTKHSTVAKAEIVQELSFDAWMHATDRIFEKQIGIDIDSVMGDWNSRDMFDDGMSPSEAAGSLASELGAEYEGMLL